MSAEMDISPTVIEKALQLFRLMCSCMSTDI